MLVLGLILILLSAGTVIGVLASGTDDKAVLYGDTLHMPTLVVFLAGAATLLVFIMGLELVRSGIRRANENRKTKKRLRKLEAQEEQRTEPGSAPATPREGDDTGTDTHPGTDTDTGTSTGTGTSTTTPTTTAEDTRTDPGTAGGPYQAPPPPSR